MKSQEFYYIFVYPVTIPQLYRLRSVECKDFFGKDAKEDS